MKGTVVIVFLFLATTLSAQSVALIATPKGVVVTTGEPKNSIEIYDLDAKTIVRTLPGPRRPTHLVTAGSRVAILDMLHNEVHLVDAGRRTVSKMTTAESPVDAVFHNNELFVIARDARMLEKFGSAPRSQSTTIPADCSFIRAGRNHLYLYSRTEGFLVEIDPVALRITRRLAIEAFASDLEIDEDYAYLAYPATGKVRGVNLETLTAAEPVKAGAVPIDIHISPHGTALTGRTMVVADPASKRIWITETTQSALEAFARGFLRGLIGLGLYGGRTSKFATGIDRVAASREMSVTYDSSTRTLFSYSRDTTRTVARDVPPRAFSVLNDSVYFWSDGRLQRFRNADIPRR